MRVRVLKLNDEVVYFSIFSFSLKYNNKHLITNIYLQVIDYLLIKC